MKLEVTPMGSQVRALAERRREHPLPDEPCTSDCRQCCAAGWCWWSLQNSMIDGTKLVDNAIRTLTGD